MFHTVIVGGGLAGLTIAEHIAKQGHAPVVLERYPNLGGRVATEHYKDIHYESGAGRIFHTHKHVHALIERFQLKTYPISTESYFHNDPNSFQQLFAPLRDILLSANQDDLATHTIDELVPDIYKPILKMYPYWAEIYKLRADIALLEFTSTNPMGATDGSKPTYVGLQGGMDTLTTHLAKEAQEAGADIRTRHRVHDIQRNGDLFEITGTFGKKATPHPFSYTARRVIVATDRVSLGQFTVTKDLPWLKNLVAVPLLRIYAIYPVDSTTNLAWFASIHRTITSSPLRHIIPINPKTGLIMISYTDGDDTNMWRTLEGSELQTKIQQEVRALFPTYNIPEPTYLKKHDWKEGCTYWLPGHYDVHKTSLELHNPYPNLYICGEAISTNQAWMEGALESAETLKTLMPM